LLLAGEIIKQEKKQKKYRIKKINWAQDRGQWGSSEEKGVLKG
jgi:hypothetical protein